MTLDEARRLLAGYATGSLSQSEQKALFEAALEDQDLFEELAGEHMLKDVLDQPGARERLISALEPLPSRAMWWMRPWPWAAAAAMLAIAIGVTMAVRTRAPQEQPQQIAQVMKAPETSIPQAAPIAPPPAPAPVPRKLERPTPPPPPADAPATDRVEELAANDRAAPRTQNFAAAKTAGGFALTYRVQPDAFLQIIPDAPGYLSVTAGDSVIFPSAPVPPGSPVRIAIPADAIILTVSFSASPATSGTPVRLDALSGTVVDQLPPTQRISIQIPAKP